MLKVHPIPFHGRTFPINGDQFLDYEIGKDKWYWSSKDQADIFITESTLHGIEYVRRDGWNDLGKPILHLHIQHYDDGQAEVFHEWNKRLLSHMYIVGELYIVDCPKKYIFTQFSQNVVRSYATKFEFTFPYEKFYYHNPKAFGHVNDNFDPENRTKIYISASKTHNANSLRSCYIRRQIIDILWNKYRDLGHIGNKDNLGVWLADNSFEAPNLEHLIWQTKEPGKLIAFGQNYPHLLYYQDTFISFYGETYEGEFDNHARGVTEKTWAPLMQGHFILPFGAAGLIEYLKGLGIQFPNEINYGYDSILNYKERTVAYLEEMERLCNIPLNQWKDIYKSNIDLLKHNQDYMIKRPIDKCDVLRKIGFTKE